MQKVSKYVEVAGATHSKFISHNRFKVVAYKSTKLFYNSGGYSVKAFNETAVTLINGTGNSNISFD